MYRGNLVALIYFCEDKKTHFVISACRDCRYEDNLVWRFSDGAAATDPDLCYLFRHVFAKKTCWPFCSAADYLFTSREKYVSHYSHRRLIAVFLLQCGLSDWPAARIIARLVVWGTGWHTLGLSAQCFHLYQGLEVAVLFSSTRANVARQKILEEEHSDITYYTIKGWTVFHTKHISPISRKQNSAL